MHGKKERIPWYIHLSLVLVDRSTQLDTVTCDGKVCLSAFICSSHHLNSLLYSLPLDKGLKLPGKCEGRRKKKEKEMRNSHRYTLCLRRLQITQLY